MSQLSVDFKTPYFIERNRTQILSVPLYASGVTVSPTSGTITIKDSSGTAIINAAAVSVSGSVATYSLADSSIPTITFLSDMWTVSWDLLVTAPGLAATSHVFRNEAHLVLRSLYPVVSDNDLTTRHSDLLNTVNLATLQDYIDASWDRVQNELINLGKRPQLIISSYALKEPHINLALSLIFRDQSTYSQGTDGKYASLSQFYKEQYEKGMESLRLVYDYNEDGEIAAEEQGVAGFPVLFLN